jgi:hypothetical protein
MTLYRECGAWKAVPPKGRELHELDVAALRRCVTVIPGRYWVLANGVGGPENGRRGVRRR